MVTLKFQYYKKIGRYCLSLKLVETHLISLFCFGAVVQQLCILIPNPNIMSEAKGKLNKAMNIFSLWRTSQPLAVLFITKYSHKP